MEMDNSSELKGGEILAHRNSLVLYSNWIKQGEWSEEWCHDQIDPHWRKSKFISAQGGWYSNSYSSLFLNTKAIEVGFRNKHLGHIFSPIISYS